MSKPLPPVIQEGERDVLLTSFAGSMRSGGGSPQAVLKALRVENEKRCEPPLPDKQLRKIARSSEKWETNFGRADAERLAALLKLNETYAVTRVGSGAVILMEDGDEIVFLKESDFRLLLRNRFVQYRNKDGETKRRPLHRCWLEWEDRRQYSRVVFEPSAEGEPGQASDPDAYNLWRGWAVEPTVLKGEGRCDLFLKHLGKIVCRGNRAHYEWLLDWLAHLFQKPQVKAESAVALRGVPGAGKTKVGEVIGKLLGPYHLLVEKSNQITGRFNGHLAYCLLAQLEEAFWAGDKRGQSALKHLVTSKTLQIERKGIDSVKMPNYTRLLVTSNEDWVWPADLDDRRLVIFDVSPKRAEDFDYFRAMTEQLEDGGYEKLLHLLLTREIDEKRLRAELPRTKAFEEQVIHTLEPHEAWLLGLLKSGALPGGYVDVSGNAHVRIGELREDYLAKTNPRHALSPEQFGLFLRKHLPRAKKVKPRCRRRFFDSRGRKRQTRRVVLRPLGACRRRYGKRGRGAPRAWRKRQGRGSPSWRVVE